MLSRRHIRVKVLQGLYSYYSDEADTVNTAQLTRALDKNISKLYDLYLYLLIFVEELGNFVAQYEEEVKARYIPNEAEATSSAKLSQNPVLQRLMKDEAFHKATKKHAIHWQGDNDILRRIFLDLKNQEAYKDFVQMGAQNPVLSQEVLLFVIKHYTSNSSSLQQHLEEHFYNWLDDRKIALQMAIKTIQQIANTPENESFLLPLSDNEEDNFEYAHQLLKLTIKEDKKIEEIISTKVTKWEPHQIALIDGIILKMAVCEFLHFPSIPAKVTINEYIELAKNYSTPQSKKFVNGVLDAILKDLGKESSFIKK
ncbi:MAG: transcription antitermination factor NusB [Bacteroidia bacterium]